MTAPVQRLSALDSVTDDVLARAVRAANAADPSAAELGRIGALVTARVVAGGGATGAAGGSIVALRSLGTLAVVAGLVGYGLVTREASVRSPTRPGEASRAAPVAPPPPVSPRIEPSVEPAPEASVVPAPSIKAAARQVPARVAASGPTPSELDLLRAAETALDDDPTSALARTEEHLRAYPEGLLAQERELLAIDALVRLGRLAVAERRAQQFEQHHPHSPLLRRMARVLGPTRFENDRPDRTSMDREDTEP